VTGQRPAVVFGRHLRQVRHERGLSQTQLAQRAGLHSSEIGRLEHGRRDPRLQTIVTLAAALGVPVARLVDGLPECGP